MQHFSGQTCQPHQNGSPLVAPVLYNPIAFLASHMHKVVLTHHEYLWVRVPICRALGGPVGRANTQVQWVKLPSLASGHSVSRNMSSGRLSQFITAQGAAHLDGSGPARNTLVKRIRKPKKFAEAHHLLRAHGFLVQARFVKVTVASLQPVAEVFVDVSIPHGQPGARGQHLV